MSHGKQREHTQMGHVKCPTNVWQTWPMTADTNVIRRHSEFQDGVGRPGRYYSLEWA